MYQEKKNNEIQPHFTKTKQNKNKTKQKKQNKKKP